MTESSTEPTERTSRAAFSRNASRVGCTAGDQEPSGAEGNARNTAQVRAVREEGPAGSGCLASLHAQQERSSQFLNKLTEPDTRPYAASPESLR